MQSGQESPLLVLPSEIRLLIYDFLFDDGGHTCLAVRNLPNGKSSSSSSRNDGTYGRRQSRYLVYERSGWRQRCHETTYALSTPDASFHPAIMATCRQVYREAPHVLYGRHSFDFGHHVSAVAPFLSDRSPATLQLIRGISVRKAGPGAAEDCDAGAWAAMCAFLQGRTIPTAIRRLRLTVEGGRLPPGSSWTGPMELSGSDLRLLTAMEHASVMWVAQLSRVTGIRELEIRSDMEYLPVSSTTDMKLYAALSASIHRGLKEFLQAEMTGVKVSSLVGGGGATT